MKLLMDVHVDKVLQLLQLMGPRVNSMQGSASQLSRSTVLTTSYDDL